MGNISVEDMALYEALSKEREEIAKYCAERRRANAAPQEPVPIEEPIPPPLCVWCSAPWTDDMLRVSAEADYCSGDYGGVDGIETTIDVICSTCNRLVYQKHVQQDGNYGTGYVVKG